MKLVILLAILMVIVACCQAQLNPAYTGQPGCLTEEELTVGLYPHFRDKRAYWRCSLLGQAGTLEFCPITQGYLDPVKACVPWLTWYWTPTVAPPSVPVRPTLVESEGSGQ